MATEELSLRLVLLGDQARLGLGELTREVSVEMTISTACGDRTRFNLVPSLSCRETQNSGYLF